MRFIDKSQEPQTLNNLKNIRYTKFKPQFDNLPPAVIADIMRTLLYDQGFLCCYTLDEITPETAILIHFNPIEHFPDQELDYSNMFLALRQPEKLPPQYQVGYMAKRDTIIPDYISDRRCAGYFRYNTLGEIIPAGTFRTVKKCRDNFRKLSPEQQTLFCTIEVLNLNAERLKQQRKAIMQEVLTLARKVSKSQIAKITKKLEERDQQGRFRRFNEVMIYFLKNA